MNLFILLTGFMLMALLSVYPRSGEWSGAIVTLYFMLQFFPTLLMEIRNLNYYKLMRNRRTTRKAELQPRRFFDFVSPKIIALAALVYFAFILFVYYINQFEFPWFGGYWNIAGITAGNIFFAAIIFWNMYGKKTDPFQAHEDRLRQIELIVKQMVFISIVMTIYVTIVVSLSALDLRSLQPAVRSLYFQLIAVISLWSLRIDNINFTVYKEDSSQESNEKMNSMVNEEETDNEKNSHRKKRVGLALGLSFGVVLALILAPNVFGLVLGASTGMILGIVIGSLIDSRKGASPII
jgi:hypothetical protein